MGYRLTSFTNFLLNEVERDDDRAKKLGNYLAGRHRKYGHYVNPWKKGIAFKHWDKYVYDNLELHPGMRNVTHQTFANLPTTSVHLKSLVPIQQATHFDDKGAKTKFQDKEPMYVVNHKGTNYVWNGHHRMMRDRLRGRSHGPAKVLHLNDDE